MNCPRCKNPLSDTKDPTKKACLTCNKFYRITVKPKDTSSIANADLSATKQTSVSVSNSVQTRNLQNGAALKPQVTAKRLSVFVCSTCGSRDYENTESGKLRCLCCGNAYDEVKELPFERDLSQADNLRQAADFETARTIYKNIINTYPNDNLTSAYWGLFLAENNVVFERDGKGNIFPSFYRVQTSSCLANPNYLKAIECCLSYDPMNTAKLTELVNTVEHARQMYWDIADKEKAFDVFICFRNDNGISTNLANRLYFNLSQKYKVFYSNETLSVLKSSYRDYEPNIYHALYTAKVMLLICKDIDGVESQWVKNEWTRFTALNKRANMNKTIIPIFLDGFNPNDLPDQLWHSQGLFADFELFSRLEKQLATYLEKAPTKSSTKSKEDFMWFKIREMQDFDDARSLANNVLEADRENSNAWLGLAFCDLKIHTDEQMIMSSAWKSNKNMQMAIKYANDNSYVLTLMDKRTTLETKQKLLDILKKIAIEKRKDAERKLAEQRKRIADEQRKIKDEEDRRAVIKRMDEERRLSEEQRLLEQRYLEEQIRYREQQQRIKNNLMRFKFDGKYLEFGLYPQTKVTDIATIRALGDYKNNKWISFKYHTNSKVEDYMFYCDKTYNGTKYRGVYFTDYRPISLSCKSKDNYQLENGYKKKTVYWFKYEPIKWLVVNKDEAFVTLVSNVILDSQHFSSNSNNYKDSYIRTWLSSSFLNTAFDSELQRFIENIEVDNSGASTCFNDNQYACANTDDKILLLSYKEIKSFFESDRSRQKNGTDYAICQGLYISNKTGYSNWWLRSPSTRYGTRSFSVANNGVVEQDYTFNTYVGVVPGIIIKL